MYKRQEHTLPIQEWWKDRKEIISDEVGEKSRVFTAQQSIDLDCNFDQCRFPKEEEEILPPAELLKQYFEKRAAPDHEIDKTLSEIQKILGIDIKSWFRLVAAAAGAAGGAGDIHRAAGHPAGGGAGRGAHGL